MIRWVMAAAALTLAPVAMATAQNWNAEVENTGQGFRIGDAEAPIQLIEFVSYTCPHCATFEAQAEAELRYVYVHEGYASVEVRHLIRNPVDLAAALLTECGDDSRFFDNHRVMLGGQPEWLATAQSLTPAQMQRWSAGPVPARMRAIASDLGFYEMMERRGYSRSELDQCLSDQPRAEAIAALSASNSAEYSVPGTPSFVVNGQLLDGVHSWPSLRQALQAARTASE